MDSLTVIALQRLFTNRQILTLKTRLGRMPENTEQWNQIIEMGIIEQKVTIPEITRAFSEAQRIIDESLEQEIGIITLFDEGFPEPLTSFKRKGLYDIPLTLYYKGNIRNVSRMEAIAIIGTRNPTADGLKMGEYYGKYFASQGFNIVSGLALGCDTAAHKGALSAKGITTAFVGHGLDSIHPPVNKYLAERIIASNGAIVSEYPIGTPVCFQNLVDRNRLQAGLSDAVILIQSDDKKGGSMHAVNIANENHKPAFAVQFDNERANLDKMTQGNVRLIREKRAAALTPDKVEDVIRAIEGN
jgi:DNA processing protein